MSCHDCVDRWDAGMTADFWKYQKQTFSIIIFLIQFVGNFLSIKGKGALEGIAY